MYIQHMFNKHNMECHHAGLHTITLHNMHTANVHVSTYTYNMDRYCACKMCMHNVRGVGGGYKMLGPRLSIQLTALSRVGSAMIKTSY